jgi:arabinose-5-phosphate isomerase
MNAKGFTRDDFGMHHPAGALGLRLQRVRDWMLLAPHDVPTIAPDLGAADGVCAVTQGQKGCVGVVDPSGRLVGVITDGDLRRAMNTDFFSRTAGDMMTRSPRTVDRDSRMADVIQMMVEERIAAVFVVDSEAPVALLHVKDLMQRGYM